MCKTAGPGDRPSRAEQPPERASFVVCTLAAAAQAAADSSRDAEHVTMFLVLETPPLRLTDQPLRCRARSLAAQQVSMINLFDLKNKKAAAAAASASGAGPKSPGQIRVQRVRGHAARRPLWWRRSVVDRPPLALIAAPSALRGSHGPSRRLPAVLHAQRAAPRRVVHRVAGSARRHTSMSPLARSVADGWRCLALARLVPSRSST